VTSEPRVKTLFEARVVPAGRYPSTAERDSKGESRFFAQDDKSRVKIKSSGQECPLHTSIFFAGIAAAAEAGGIVDAWRRD
jgi:hypothetical protein